MLSAEFVDAAIFGLMARYGDMSMHAVVDLRRTFSRAEFEGALSRTIAAFPVLGHRYAPGLWRDRWVEVPGPISDCVHVVPMDGGDSACGGGLEEVTERWVRKPLVSTRDRPVRLVGLRHGDEIRLILSVLHIAGDGAAVAAVSRVLSANLRGGGSSELPVNPRRDFRHALDGLRWFQRPRLARSEVRLALEPLLNLAAAKRDRPAPTDRSAGALWKHLVVKAEDLQRTKRSCAAGTSVNDVLIAVLARVAGAQSRGRPVIVMYTMDLRRWATTPRLTTTNSSSILAARVPRRALSGNLASVAAVVTAITRRQQRRLDGPAYLLGPRRLGGVLPHAVVRQGAKLVAPIMVDAPLARGFLVTNVGRIDEGLRTFGDDLRQIRFVGPFVKHLPVPVVVAFGYRGELHLEVFAAPGLGEGPLTELAGAIAGSLLRRPSAAGGDERQRPKDRTVIVTYPKGDLANAVWIDLLAPTHEEVLRAKQATGLRVPKESELREIESTSRLAFENGAYYVSTPIVAAHDDKEHVGTVAGFVLSSRVLLTVRFAALPAFDAAHSLCALHETTTAEDAFLHMFEMIVDHSADELERAGGDCDDLSRRAFRNGGGRVRSEVATHLSTALRRVGKVADRIASIREGLLGLGRIGAYVMESGIRGAPPVNAMRMKAIRSDVASLTEYESHLSGQVQFLLDATLGFINIEQNEIVKTLTIASVVGIPPVLVAGIYGMNFRYMPELGWTFGYPMAMGLIVVSALVPLLWFKRRGWM